MGNITPETVITVAAFRDKAVDMGIPFQIPAKGVKNHNKSRSKILGFIEFVKHTADHAGNRVEKAVKKIGIVQKKCLRSSSIVKTQCRCWTGMSLKDILVARSIEYLFLQVGQKRL